MIPFILACPPKAQDELLKVGILHLEVTDDHKVEKCAQCGCEVWIGPKQLKLQTKIPELRIHCFGCAKQNMEEGKSSPAVIPIGKGGARYITTDGKIIAEGKD